MYTIDRYLLKQLLVTFAMGVLVLSVILVLGNVFKRLLDLLVNHDIPVEFILNFIAYVLPFSLTFTIPWGLLTAVLLTMGRLSADNEILALKSSGISIFRLCSPLLFLALGLCLICYWINADVAPKAQTKMKRTLVEIATSNPLALFGHDQIIEDFPGRKIYIAKKNGNNVENIQVFEMDQSHIPVRTMIAKRGKLEADLENKRILMKLHNANFQQRDSNNASEVRNIKYGRMEEAVIAISLQKLYDANAIRLGLSSMTIPQLKNRLADVKSMKPENWKDDEAPSPIRTEIHKRYSFSIACLAFTLLGVPLGMTTHRRETSIGFALSLIVAFTYFLFIILADTFRQKPAAHPEFLIWLPNIIFLGLGVFLFWRENQK